ncbi:hypothetical protein TBLA_0D04810 [Henningerozyma blattae CBS 6284]|uniref:Uncharacterized protein n=1 Tax=Henningerozyma blattae (strain ATCC 34711 / CBS 6284 / DSM 70876 / NBRC 10599 / NRRL Y-10934 / UCD 77-7) TaxID=1071380 RepID=I2H3M5_HENB6|nr:hypothetical protein TBLA_0D04810 [Tetrapisispora blattae CBS 6284]CCH60977.1 hypothetical protein TBLA_0D04810 [Tetrapisispora blattae CBS 6284]
MASFTLVYFGTNLLFIQNFHFDAHWHIYQEFNQFIFLPLNIFLKLFFNTSIINILYNSKKISVFYFFIAIIQYFLVIVSFGIMIGLLTGGFLGYIQSNLKVPDYSIDIPIWKYSTLIFSFIKIRFFETQTSIKDVLYSIKANFRRLFKNINIIITDDIMTSDSIINTINDTPNIDNKTSNIDMNDSKYLRNSLIDYGSTPTPTLRSKKNSDITPNRSSLPTKEEVLDLMTKLPSNYFQNDNNNDYINGAIQLQTPKSENGTFDNSIESNNNFGSQEGDSTSDMSDIWDNTTNTNIPNSLRTDTDAGYTTIPTTISTGQFIKATGRSSPITSTTRKYTK